MGFPDGFRLLEHFRSWSIVSGILVCLKVTFFNFVPESAVTRHIFSKTWDPGTLWTLQTLARHREKQFSMTVRIKKIPKCKTSFKHEKFSSEKKNWKFLGDFFFGKFSVKKWKSGKSNFWWKMFEFRILKIFRILPEIFPKFFAQKFQKIFSDENFSCLKNVSNFGNFFIRTVIENCFSLCLANVCNVRKVPGSQVLLKMWRVTAIYQFIRYKVRKRDF